MNSLKAKFIIDKIKRSTNAISTQNQDKLNFLLHHKDRSLSLQNLSDSLENFNNKVLKKGNPFFFIRKNFVKLFSNFLKRSFLTPNLIKFLHMAYWPKNDYMPWRMFFTTDPLDFKLGTKAPLISQSLYFFSLIFKKTNFFNLKNLISSDKHKKKYFTYLNYLYSLNVKKKINNKKSRYFIAKKNYLSLIKQSKLSKINLRRFLKNKINTNFKGLKNTLKFKYFKIPKFIMKDRRKKEFKNFFLLTFRQRSFLKNLINFYFPVISITIKEMTIHSLPMKTKKPRRV